MSLLAAPFSKNRRDEIAEKLKEGARLSAAKRGMKKTSIDALVDYADISKGAFYKFYESKDELFLEMVEDWHTEIYGSALDILTEKNGLPYKTKAAKAILCACELLDRDSVMKFIKNDLAHLLKNISGTELEKRYHGDDIHINEVIRFSGIKLLVTNDEAVSIVKNLAFTVLNSDMNGYWHSQKILINSVCDFIVK